MRRCFLMIALLVGATNAAAQRAPSIVLSHLRIGLDSATWADVQRSDFFQHQLAGQLATRGVAGEHVTYFGRRQWLALAPGEGTHSLTIGLSVDESRRVPALVGVWRRNGVRLDSTTVMRTDGASALPWYLRWAPPPSPTAMLSIELTAYHPTLFEAMVAFDSLAPDMTDRARALQRDYLPSRHFAEVTGATFAVPVAEIRQLRETLRSGAIAVADEGEGLVVLLEDGVRLRFIPAWERPGVRRIEFFLTEAVAANPSYRFGPRSQFRFGPGRVAVWDFDLP